MKRLHLLWNMNHVSISGQTSVSDIKAGILVLAASDVFRAENYCHTQVQMDNLLLSQTHPIRASSPPSFFFLALHLLQKVFHSSFNISVMFMHWFEILENKAALFGWTCQFKLWTNSLDKCRPCQTNADQCGHKDTVLCSWLQSINLLIHSIKHKKFN